MHHNYGHPDQAVFVRALIRAGASDEAILAALRCSTCIRLRACDHPRPSRIPRGTFNQFVALDMFYLRDASRTQFTFLSVLDLSGLLHVVAMTESRSAKHLLELFGLMWMSWAGTPESIYIDPDTGFGGDFANYFT